MELHFDRSDARLEPQVSDEARLLFAALRAPNAPDLSLLASADQAQWTAVADLALRHRLGPFLYSRTDLPIPMPVLAQLQPSALSCARRFNLLQDALIELADALTARNVEVIVLKGLYLALTAYPSPTMRPMADLDVIVPAHQLDEAWLVAARLGYRPHGTMTVEDAVNGTQHLPPLVKHVKLEIHHRLAPPGNPPFVSFDSLRQRAQPIPNTGALGLCPEDALIHVCAHAVDHHRLATGLRPLVDLQALVARRGSDIDWSVLVQRAIAWECTRSVALMLFLGKQHLGVPVPEHVLAMLPQPPPGRVEAAAIVAATHDAVAGVITGREPMIVFHGRGLAGKARSLWSRLSLRPELLALKYPGTARDGWRRWWLWSRRLVDVIQRCGIWLLRAALGMDRVRRSTVARRNTVAKWIRDERG